MPKLRDILTNEEHNIIGEMRLKMSNAETTKESDYYKAEIEKIFEQAKARYFASQVSQPTAKMVVK